MTLMLHKAAVFDAAEGDASCRQTFTFVLDNIHKFIGESARSHSFMNHSHYNRSDSGCGSGSGGGCVESNEINYGGHTWTVVCARKVRGQPTPDFGFVPV